MADFVFMPAIICGAVIGIYEILLIHRDVRVPTHRFGHGIHALVFALVATLAVFNVEWLLNNVAFLEGIPLIGTSPLYLQIAIGLISAVKIHGVSAAIKSTGVAMGAVGLRETWFHSFLVGALIVAAPYVWPLFSGVLPEWMQA